MAIALAVSCSPNLAVNLLLGTFHGIRRAHITRCKAVFWVRDRLRTGETNGIGWTRNRKLIAPTFRAAAGNETEHGDKGKASQGTASSSRETGGKVVNVIKRQKPPGNLSRDGKQARPRTVWKLSNLVEEWVAFMGPREKGDLRDVILMSLSFAVLIYISQHLVHAYCTLRHMYRSFP